MDGDQSLRDQVSHLQAQGYTQEQIIAALHTSGPTTPTPTAPATSAQTGLHKRVDAISAIVVVGLVLIGLAITIIVSNKWTAISAWGRISLVLVPVAIVYLVALLTAKRAEQDTVHRGTLLLATILMPVLLGTMLVQLQVWPVFNASLFSWCTAAGWLLFLILEWTWKRQPVAPLTLLMASLSGIGLLAHYQPETERIPWYIVVAGLVVTLIGRLYGRKQQMGIPRVVYGMTMAILAFPIGVSMQLHSLHIDWQIGAWVLAAIGIIYWYLSRFVRIAQDATWQRETAQLQSLLREGGWIVALVSIYTLLGSAWWYVWIVLAVSVLATVLSVALPVYSLVPIGSLGILISSFAMLDVTHGLWVPGVAAAIGLILILSAIKVRIASYIPLGTFMLVTSVLVISSEVFTNAVSWPISVFILGLFFIGLGIMLNRITHWREGQITTYHPLVSVADAPEKGVRQGSCLRSCLTLVIFYVLFISLVQILAR